MAAEMYPSGAWRGFYSYGVGDRHRMQLDLLFSRGLITGDGVDDIAGFLINGSYDAESGGCHWTKSYIGAHQVQYAGVRSGKGIAGTWQLGSGQGGFRIWPAEQEETTGAEESVEAAEPVEAVLTH